MAYACMADNVHLTAFQLREIFKKIEHSKDGGFIKWYIVTGILFFVLLLIVAFDKEISRIRIQSILVLVKIPIQSLIDLLASLFSSTLSLYVYWKINSIVFL